jgi:hypothetical protein
MQWRTVQARLSCFARNGRNAQGKKVGTEPLRQGRRGEAVPAIPGHVTRLRRLRESGHLGRVSWLMRVSINCGYGSGSGLLGALAPVGECLYLCRIVWKRTKVPLPTVCWRVAPTGRQSGRRVSCKERACFQVKPVDASLLAPVYANFVGERRAKSIA